MNTDTRPTLDGLADYLRQQANALRGNGDSAAASISTLEGWASALTDTRPNGDEATILTNAEIEDEIRAISHNRTISAERLAHARAVERAVLRKLAASRPSGEAGVSGELPKLREGLFAEYAPIWEAIWNWAKDADDDPTKAEAVNLAIADEMGDYARAALASQPQGVSGWDVARKLAKLAQHAKGCTVYDPLPTGEGTWGCTCGKDSLVLDGELLNEPTSAPQGVSLSDERLRELLEAHCDKHEEFDQNGQARWTGAYLIMPESLRSLLSAPGQEGRAVPQGMAGWLTNGASLHPLTINLVVRFSRALAAKLADAEKKYGYSDGWKDVRWMDECRRHLLEHVAKGDPRDVAAYCAFLWHHGESTSAAPSQEVKDGHALHAAIMNLRPDCELPPAATVAFKAGHKQARHAAAELLAGVSALVESKTLTGDAKLAHDQCRAVVALANGLAEVHHARALILEAGQGPVTVIGESSSEIMEWLGDALSNMDAVDEDDEWMDSVFEAAHARWPTPPAQDAASPSPEVKDAEGKDAPTDTERLEFLHEWHLSQGEYVGGDEIEAEGRVIALSYVDTTGDVSSIDALRFSIDAAIASQKGSA